MTPARIALFVLEALPNAVAVRRLVADHAADIAFVGMSDPMRPAAGGVVGQLRRHLARSGPGILPYLAVNFGLPDLLRPMAPLVQAFASPRDEATPLHTLCRRLGIACVGIADVNGAECRERLQATAPDLIVSYHFDQIFAADTLALARLGGVNLHPSLLPRHRGPTPTIHALAEGAGSFGATLHRLVPAIDAGAILAQRAVALPPGTTATRAARLLHDAGRPLLDDALDAVARTGALPSSRDVARLAYRPWPDRALLRDMRRRGLALTDAADLAAALTLSAGRS